MASSIGTNSERLRGGRAGADLAIAPEVPEKARHVTWDDVVDGQEAVASAEELS
jgi:hypothetical protein